MVRWCAARDRPVGAVISLDRAWALASAWYADRLSLEWRRRTAAEAQTLLTGLGLDAPFWRLTPG